MGVHLFYLLVYWFLFSPALIQSFLLRVKRIFECQFNSKPNEFVILNSTINKFSTSISATSKKMNFSDKANIYYRLEKLIGKQFMGDVFKVMLLTNNKTKFKIGFWNWLRQKNYRPKGVLHMGFLDRKEVYQKEFIKV